MDTIVKQESDLIENQGDKKKSISSRLGIYCPTNKVKEFFTRRFNELTPAIAGEKMSCKTAWSITPLMPTFIDFIVKEYITHAISMLIDSNDKTLNIKHLKMLNDTDFELNKIISKLSTFKNIDTYGKSNKQTDVFYQKSEDKDFLNMVAKIYKEIKDTNGRTEHISKNAKTYINDMIYEIISVLTLDMVQLYTFGITTHRIISNNIILYVINNMCKDMNVIINKQIMKEIEDKKIIYEEMAKKN